jgi:hypothetical protein
MSSTTGILSHNDEDILRLPNLPELEKNFEPTMGVDDCRHNQLWTSNDSIVWLQYPLNIPWHNAVISLTFMPGPWLK